MSTSEMISGTMTTAYRSAPITRDSSEKCILTYDANGNCCDMVDTTGSVAAHYEYGPFGSTTASSGALANANPWQFSTKYFDPETDLYYYGHRYYSPTLGRWLSRDSIAERGGKNLYRFALNSSINFIDALGRFTLPIVFLPPTTGTAKNHDCIIHLAVGHSTSVENSIEALFLEVRDKLGPCHKFAPVGCRSYYHFYYSPETERQEEGPRPPHYGPGRPDPDNPTGLPRLVEDPDPPTPPPPDYWVPGFPAIDADLNSGIGCNDRMTGLTPRLVMHMIRAVENAAKGMCDSSCCCKSVEVKISDRGGAFTAPWNDIIDDFPDEPWGHYRLKENKTRSYKIKCPEKRTEA